MGDGFQKTVSIPKFTILQGHILIELCFLPWPAPCSPKRRLVIWCTSHLDGVKQVTLTLFCTVADGFTAEVLNNQIASALFLPTATLVNFNNDCTKAPWTRLFVSLGGHSLEYFRSWRYCGYRASCKDKRKFHLTGNHCEEQSRSGQTSRGGEEYTLNECNV